MASKCVFDTLFYFGFAVCLLPLLLLPRTLSLSRSRSLSLYIYISLSLSVAVTGTLVGVNVGVNRFASLKVKPRRLDTCVITFDGFIQTPVTYRVGSKSIIPLCYRGLQTEIVPR